MKGIWALIKSIGKFIQGLGSLAVGLFVLIILAVAIGVNQPEKLPNVPDGAVLVLAPSGVIVEQTALPDPFAAALPQYNNQPPQVSIHDITTALKRAKSDDRIAALAILTDSLWGAGPSHLHTIAGAIGDFKESGKKVYAISTAYSQSAYLLAAQADKVYLNPAGNVLLSGYGSYPIYFKSMLDKIGATVNVFRVGTYKAAVEPFIRDDMSPAAKEANLAFLGGLWDQYTSSVENARNMEAGAIQASFENLATDFAAVNGNFGEYAKQQNLVDELAARITWRDALAEEFGYNDNGSSFNQIHYRSYLSATQGMRETSKNKIAVITAQGNIVMGEGPVQVAAAETIVDYIRSARENSNTKAIVLRVDSPGGSAFASELIRQELAVAQEQGIKVIASMGPVAASGGYWISATADEIWAAPSTITGSIGIFGMLPTYENTLDKIGVHSDGVGTTPLASGFSPTRALNDTTKMLIQGSIENGYDEFLSLVARGRNMSKEDVDKIAQGRVWIGETAKELGLVDHLGGFDDAVKAAAAAAGVDDYEVAFYREKIDPFDQLLLDMLNSTVGIDGIGNGQTSTITKLLQKTEGLQESVEFLTTLNDPQNRYVVCMTCEVRQ
ncbi:signal peptide peptidase SppA [Kordiimonas laminariae]|uniref:signal peptide peptidase SppA n=1 Tax=Kordiimonas laminariae TaxID=2917717 RepID=UPI001FF68211|nr:signal peptide peptidase SppA [Kordiimonas laminariae]MCK0068578.1 signal peptide peptidase SppA [Kordiimonas laminariae]